MKTFALLSRQDLFLSAPANKPASSLPRLEKLTDLTHRFQHLLRYKPRGMYWLLPYYHYFLNIKEKVEHYFTSGQLPIPAGTAETRGRDLTILREELAALLGPAAPQHLKRNSPALFLLFVELEKLLKENGGAPQPPGHLA